MKGAALSLALAVMAGSAMAQKPLPRSELPGLGENDPRRPVEVSRAPWTSLGRVQTEVGGRCTGTLVAPRLVLTAAHCLVARTGKFVQPASVHFLLGYDRGRAAAQARVVDFRVGEGFVLGVPSPVSADWAVLLLEAPLRAPVLPVWAGRPPERTPLVLGGYQQDMPERLLADTGCRIIGAANGAVTHDCAGTRGASGAPLLAEIGGRWQVMGVASRVRRDIALGEAAGTEGPRRVLQGQ
ncbi:trypsin-like serine peptidase [Roseococcus sp. DSY-14]|uniref:trypsin-like serine peptidase n=1 Tax=Roseococcus sp. DSY-14 TaxID=3369650 RepID=UPI00387B5EDE